MDDVRIVAVDAGNVEPEGFFCYKSKPKSEGYRRKLAWLGERLAEGMGLHILYEGKRSVGYIEYMPGELAWRAVNAPGYLIIHCLWVVGRGKGKGYGSRLVRLCEEDARQRGMRGVAMVTTRRVWLADERLLARHGYDAVDEAAPFKLMAKTWAEGPRPSFPTDWAQRAAAFGPGVTVAYADQCPYMPDAVQGAVAAAAKHGIEARTVKLASAAELQRRAPSPYGVFAVVHDGELFSYHYLGKKELAAFDERLAGA